MTAVADGHVNSKIPLRPPNGPGHFGDELQDAVAGPIFSAVASDGVKTNLPLRPPRPGQPGHELQEACAGAHSFRLNAIATIKPERLDR